MNTIRDKREAKRITQLNLAKAARLSFSTLRRIEAGGPTTTDAEVEKVLKALDKMKPGTGRIGGPPFKDPKTQKAVLAARELGTSVSAVLNGTTKAPATKKATAAKKAPAKKATAKKTTTSKK